MFNEKLQKLMKERELTARELRNTLNEKGVKVSIWTVRAWMQGSRQPKPYVQDAILHVLATS